MVPCAQPKIWRKIQKNGGGISLASPAVRIYVGPLFENWIGRNIPTPMIMVQLVEMIGILLTPMITLVLVEMIGTTKRKPAVVFGQ